ncbi:MAG: CHAT domain-containing protein [Planctomycetaceae bacterium]
MNRPTLKFSGNATGSAIQWCNVPTASMVRRLTPTDFQLFETWRARYRDATVTRDQFALKSLGKEMSQWLNEHGHFAEVLKDAVSPLTLEIAVDEHAGKSGRDFLALPWELLTKIDGSDFLAMAPALNFTAVRRVGAAQKLLPKSPYRLSLVFMAAAPRGAGELDFRAEEGAIQEATASLEPGIDFRIEESGELEELAKVVRKETPSDDHLAVLHLSCHGSGGDNARLILENEYREPHDITAAQLAKALPTTRPRLTFLSACHSTGGDGLYSFRSIGSLAETLIEHNFPAVIGWNGSVKDDDATRFAEAFYGQVARGETMEVAMALARHELLVPTDHRPPAQDWHLARLYVGPQGGGALATGQLAKRNWDPLDDERAFLDPQGRLSPVAGGGQFVGRREPLKAILRTLKDKKSLMLHAVGRQGKSSLALRVSQRLPNHTLVFRFGQFTPVELLAALRSSTGNAVSASQWDAWANEVQQTPTNLETILKGLLEQQFSGTVSDKRILLVLDDFEQMLKAPIQAGRDYTLIESARVVVPAILRAFRDSKTESRLLITCRCGFHYPDHDGENVAASLEMLPLPEMTPLELLRQTRAKQRSEVTKSAGGKRAVPPEIPPARLERMLRAAHGNAGLMDTLNTLALQAPDVCDQALEEMERFEKSGKQPELAELVRDFNNIAIDRLLGSLSLEELTSVRLSLAWDVPLPRPVIEDFLTNTLSIANATAHVDRLLTLGVWERHADPIQHRTSALLGNRLIKLHLLGKNGELSDKEWSLIAQPIIAPLYTAWGGRMGFASSPFECDDQLIRLLLAADWQPANSVPSVIGELLDTVAAPVVQHLYHRLFRWFDAANTGRQLVTLAARLGRSANVELLIETADAVWKVYGPREITFCRQCYETAVEQLGTLAPDAERDTQRRYSVLLDRLGDLTLASGERQVALGLYVDSLDICRQTVRRFGESPQSLRDVSVSLDRVADAMRGLGVGEVVIDGVSRDPLGLYVESLDTRRQIVRRFGESPQSLRDVSISLNKVADAMRGLGVGEVAIDGVSRDPLGLYVESLDICRQIVSRFGESPEPAGCQYLAGEGGGCDAGVGSGGGRDRRGLPRPARPVRGIARHLPSDRESVWRVPREPAGCQYLAGEGGGCDAGVGSGGGRDRRGFPRPARPVRGIARHPPSDREPVRRVPREPAGCQCITTAYRRL